MFNIYLLGINFLFGRGSTSCERTQVVLNKYVVLFYSCFILLLSLFYTDHLVSIILFNYDYLNSTTLLLCLCLYSLYYHFVNLNCICNNKNSFNFILHLTLMKKSEITKYVFVNNFERCDIDVGYIYIYISIYLYLYMYLYLYIYISIYLYLFIYLSIYIHTYLHAHT